MIDDWLDHLGGDLLTVAINTIVILAIAILTIRVVGLRSLSKMSSFDFVVTIALGSVVATVAATSTPIESGALAFAVLLAAQWCVSKLRRFTRFEALVDNTPRLLMDGSKIIDANLENCRVTIHDLVAKLREANVTDLDQVLAVVFETTGDISVLHGDGPLAPQLLEGVRRESEG